MKSCLPHSLVLFTALMIFLGAACSSIPFLAEATPTQTVILHYQDEIFAFDYPSNWKIYPAGDPAFNLFPDVDDFQPPGERVVGLSNPLRSGTNRYLDSAIAIYRYTGMPEADLDKFLKGVYQNIRPTYGYEKDSEPVLIDGIPTIQKIYTRYVGEPAYRLHDQWFQKGDALFRLTILLDYHTPEDEAEYNSQVKTVLDSLKIADSPPPQ